MLEDLLLILSIRFFIFDFILFKKIREKLNQKHYIFRKLFACTFCQGFWVGLFYDMFNNPHPTYISIFRFAFISAIVSFSWTVVFYPIIKKYESEHDIHMT